jgi:hypothetical protein
MKYIGHIPMLPVKAGDKVTIRKDATVKTSQGKILTMKNNRRVKVHHVLNGYTVDAADRAYRERHGLPDVGVVNPKVVWAGSGGYWHEADINDVLEGENG